MVRFGTYGERDTHARNTHGTIRLREHQHLVNLNHVKFKNTFYKEVGTGQVLCPRSPNLLLPKGPTILAHRSAGCWTIRRLHTGFRREASRSLPLAARKICPSYRKTSACMFLKLPLSNASMPGTLGLSSLHQKDT